MDLLTYWRVVQRQRRIVIVGLVLTALISTLLLVSVSTSGVEFRSSRSYIATANLFVTQSGFPWGRSALAEYVQGQGTGTDEVAVPRFADPARMEYLANLYSELALSDDVRRIVRRNGFALRTSEEYQAAPLTTRDGRQLPLLEVSGTSDSRARAVVIANRAAGTLQTYVTNQQRESNIDEETRIVLPMITRADDAEVLQGIKLTSPLMVALLGVIATFFVAFVVDNVRRQRALADEIPDSSNEPGSVDPNAVSVHRLPPSESPRKTSAGGARSSRTRS